MQGLPQPFGPFILERRLAVGGTSEVYLARSEGDPVAMRAAGLKPLPERVIVKRPIPQYQTDTQWKAMFEREARIQAHIQHDNVVRVFQAGTAASGEPYLVMEYVDGVDGDRLVRRLRQVSELLEPGLAVHIVREVLLALEAVHQAVDDRDQPLGIVHRDVTPSNIYLSKSGEVKLGDFGLAHALHRPGMRSETGNMLKGKFAYLAPEQVAGDPVDQRADLFSAAVVLGELLLGRPLFQESGQLAVLLAIRDGRIDALDSLEQQVPKGLIAALRQGLARTPKQRFPNAAAFRKAIEPFAVDKDQAQKRLAERVRWVHTNPTAKSFRPPKSAERSAPPSSLEPKNREEVPTAEFTIPPAFVQLASGERLGPLTFAMLVESIATGLISRGDRVNYMNGGYQNVETIEALVRFLPAPTERTTELSGPGAPDFTDTISVDAVLRLFSRVAVRRETGVVFAEYPSPDGQRAIRKEIYFVHGKVQHVGATNASELLGEYLVRRGELAREELDLALAVLPRYDGRMGDTLIGLGLVDPVHVFRAIREQGRDRCTDLFRWNGGRMTYYVGQTHPRVEFPLTLDLPAVMLAGLEAIRFGEETRVTLQDRLDDRLGPGPLREDLEWPARLEHVLDQVTRPMTLRDLLQQATQSGVLAASDVLRGVEVLTLLDAIAWIPLTLPPK